MEFFLIALAAFFVVTTVQSFVQAPEWAWPALLLVASLVGLWLCSDLRHWYAAVAIAGIGHLILRADNLLMVKTDEVLASIRHPRR